VGTLFGVSAGAQLAVYGSTPDELPPVGTATEIAARLGTVRVTEATRASATAMAKPLFDVPVDARARG
jgi:hypothetical protein